MERIIRAIHCHGTTRRFLLGYGYVVRSVERNPGGFVESFDQNDEPDSGEGEEAGKKPWQT
jgi:hypothetical protein